MDNPRRTRPIETIQGCRPTGSPGRCHIPHTGIKLPRKSRSPVRIAIPQPDTLKGSPKKMKQETWQDPPFPCGRTRGNAVTEQCKPNTYGPPCAGVSNKYYSGAQAPQNTFHPGESSQQDERDIAERSYQNSQAINMEHASTSILTDSSVHNAMLPGLDGVRSGRKWTRERQWSPLARSTGYEHRKSRSSSIGGSRKGLQIRELSRTRARASSHQSDMVESFNLSVQNGAVPHQGIYASDFPHANTLSTHSDQRVRNTFSHASCSERNEDVQTRERRLSPVARCSYSDKLDNSHPPSLHLSKLNPHSSRPLSRDFSQNRASQAQSISTKVKPPKGSAQKLQESQLWKTAAVKPTVSLGLPRTPPKHKVGTGRKRHDITTWGSDVHVPDATDDNFCKESFNNLDNSSKQCWSSQSTSMSMQTRQSSFSKMSSGKVTFYDEVEDAPFLRSSYKNEQLLCVQRRQDFIKLPEGSHFDLPRSKRVSTDREIYRLADFSLSKASADVTSVVKGKTSCLGCVSDDRYTERGARLMSSSPVDQIRGEKTETQLGHRSMNALPSTEYLLSPSAPSHSPVAVTQEQGMHSMGGPLGIRDDRKYETVVGRRLRGIQTQLSADGCESLNIRQTARKQRPSEQGAATGIYGVKNCITFSAHDIPRRSDLLEVSDLNIGNPSTLVDEFRQESAVTPAHYFRSCRKCSGTKTAPKYEAGAGAVSSALPCSKYSHKEPTCTPSLITPEKQFTNPGHAHSDHLLNTGTGINTFSGNSAGRTLNSTLPKLQALGEDEPELKSFPSTSLASDKEVAEREHQSRDSYPAGDKPSTSYSTPEEKQVSGDSEVATTNEISMKSTSSNEESKVTSEKRRKKTCKGRDSWRFISHIKLKLPAMFKKRRSLSESRPITLQESLQSPTKDTSVDYDPAYTSAITRPHPKCVHLPVPQVDSISMCLLEFDTDTFFGDYEDNVSLSSFVTMATAGSNTDDNLSTTSHTLQPLAEFIDPTIPTCVENNFRLDGLQMGSPCSSTRIGEPAGVGGKGRTTRDTHYLEPQKTNDSRPTVLSQSGHSQDPVWNQPPPDQTETLSSHYHGLYVAPTENTSLKITMTSTKREGRLHMPRRKGDTPITPTALPVAKSKQAVAAVPSSKRTHKEEADTWTLLPSVQLPTTQHSTHSINRGSPGKFGTPEFVSLRSLTKDDADDKSLH